MQRLFLPVGQGAFYCEKFSEEDFCGKVNVVYDCGSISGFQALKATIEWVFEKDDSIEAVFLSHLHEDHINGLPFLMKRCHVKRVYLPMMDMDDLALMRLAYGVQRQHKQSPYDDAQDDYYMARRFVEEVLRNPVETIRRIYREYSRTREAGVEVVSIPITNADGVGLSSQTTSREVFGDMVDGGSLQKWIYAPYNVRNELETARVKDRFIQSFGPDISPSRIAELIGDANSSDDTLDEIRKLYKGIKGGFNANSMALYSGAADFSLRQCSNVDKGVFERVISRIPAFTASGCLYTGDFIAAESKPYWDELKKAYCRFWPWIGCVQIPHHGAISNFNKDFLSMTAYNVISAGFGNMYRHPSNAVLSQYWSKQSFPFVVTQNPASMFSTTVK